MNLLKNFGLKKQFLKPANKLMQKQWANMPINNKILNRSRFNDYDKDGVPNKWDCRPMNSHKHMTILYHKTSPQNVERVYKKGIIARGLFSSVPLSLKKQFIEHQDTAVMSVDIPQKDLKQYPNKDNIYYVKQVSPKHIQGTEYYKYEQDKPKYFYGETEEEARQKAIRAGYSDITSIQQLPFEEGGKIVVSAFKKISGQHVLY